MNVITKAALESIVKIYTDACDMGYDPSHCIPNEVEQLKTKKGRPTVSFEMEVEVDSIVEFLNERDEDDLAKQLNQAFLVVYPAAKLP